MVKDTQKEAIKRYEAAHDRMTIMFSKGTRDRINALDLDCTPAKFIMFATEFMLNYCESKKLDYIDTIAPGYSVDEQKEWEAKHGTV